MEHAIDLWLTAGGLVLGLAFGALVQTSRFCLTAGVSNVALMRDFRQFHAYLAAVAVAVLGAYALEAGGWVNIAESSYRSARLDWAGMSLGGLAFGFGSVLAGGCAGRTLVNAAEGKVAGLLAMAAFALAATVTQFGALEPVHRWLIETTALMLPAGSASIAALIGHPPLGVALAVALGCVGFIALVGRKSWALIAAGTGIGALVVAGWWLTGYLMQDEFEGVRPGSLTFSGPLARTTLWLATGQGSRGLDLGLVAGVLAGAALTALARRCWRWMPPDPEYVGRYLVGGTLMGVGAIFAGGCNIGNGLSGASTLSLGPLLALAAIFLGMRLGLAWLQRAERQARVAERLASGAR